MLLDEDSVDQKQFVDMSSTTLSAVSLYRVAVTNHSVDCHCDDHHDGNSDRRGHGHLNRYCPDLRTGGNDRN